MIYRRFLFFVVLIITLIGCKEPLNGSKQILDKEHLSTEILEMFDAYHASIKESGLKAEFDFLDDSSDFFWVPPGYSSPQSYDQVKKVLIENDKSISSIEFKFDTIQIYPLSNSIANYSGIVSGKMIDTTGVLSTFKIIESGTLIKRKTGWKLLNGQSRNMP